MLTIDHLEKCFGSTVLFRDLTFTVDGPAVLWAPSGWGKTTLLRILMGLETPTAGRVQGAGRVSAVFQEDRLCPCLLYTSDAADEREAPHGPAAGPLGTGGHPAAGRALYRYGPGCHTGQHRPAAGAGGGPSGAAGHPRPCRHRRTGLADAGAAEAGTAGCGLQFHK